MSIEQFQKATKVSECQALESMSQLSVARLREISAIYWGPWTE